MQTIFYLINQSVNCHKKEGFTLLETIVALSLVVVMITAAVVSLSFVNKLKENAIIKFKEKIGILKVFSMHRHNEIQPVTQNGVLLVPDIEDDVGEKNEITVRWMILSEEQSSLAILLPLKK